MKTKIVLRCCLVLPERRQTSLRVTSPKPSNQPKLSRLINCITAKGENYFGCAVPLSAWLFFKDSSVYLFQSPGRAEPASHWLRPAGSESDWSSPQLCQHPHLCPADPPERAGGHNTCRPSARRTTRWSLKREKEKTVQVELFKTI